MTGFSLADEQVGYIFNLDFLAAASVGLIPTAFAIAAFYWRRPYRPMSINLTVPALMIVFSYLFALSASSLIEPHLGFIILGLMWGIATTLLSLAWLEVLAVNSKPLELIVQLALASLLSAVIAFLFPADLDPTNSLVCCVFLATSVLALHYCRHHTAPFEPLVGTRASVETFKQIAIPLVGSMLFEMVIGMINMYTVTSHTVNIINASTPLFGMALCAFLTIAFVFFSTKLPNPSIIYLGIFPLIIAGFLLLPFFGSDYGPQISAFFYAGYNFTMLITNLYCMRAAFVYRARLYVVLALISGFTRLALAAGLLAGYAFGNMREGDEVLHLTFIAVVSVYLLGTAIVVWAFRNMRLRQSGSAGYATPGNSNVAAPRREGESGALGEGSATLGGGAGDNEEVRDSEGLGSSGGSMGSGGLGSPGSMGLGGLAGASSSGGLPRFEELLLRRVDELALEYRLTNRECDVLVRLALGNSAKSIAEELVISTSTVNGYVKNIYVKLGVNKKQQVINLFNDIVSAPDPINIIR